MTISRINEYEQAVKKSFAAVLYCRIKFIPNPSNMVYPVVPKEAKIIPSNPLFQ